MGSKRGHNQSARKLFQLCRQIERSLGFALADCRDPLLHTLEVVSVRPAPDASRLAVALVVPEDAGPEERLAASSQLRAASGRLRCEIGQAISRRRVPLLVYRIEPRAH